MADVTRDQFDESNAVTKKIFQKGNHLLDSDLNELVDIFRYQDRRMLSCLLGYENKRFEDGFKVVGTGASLAVTIKAGFAGFLIGTKLSILMQLAEDFTLNGFSAWVASRTDYVYVDVSEPEVGPDTDPDIINPDLGEETCRDLRLVYEFAISEGTAPGTPPAGHVYITLATVFKTSGSNIEAGDVTVEVEDYTSDFTNLTVGNLTVETSLDIPDDSVHKEHLNADVVAEGLAQNVDGSITVDGIVEGSASVELKIMMLNIGDWNMDSSSTKQLDTTAVLLSKIRGIRILLRKDEGVAVPALYDLTWHASGVPQGCWNLIDLGTTLRFQFFRTDAGTFDGAEWDQTSYNRGWIIIEYEA